MALEGFLTLAPDALTPVGGLRKTPASPALIGSWTARPRPELRGGGPVSQDPSALHGKVGCNRLLLGGGMTNQVAVRFARSDCGRPLLRHATGTPGRPKIKAACSPVRRQR